MASYYVGKTPKGSWRVLQEVWEGGERKQVTVPKTAYLALGLAPDMTHEQAKKRIEQVNRERRVEHQQVTQAACRVAAIGFYDETFFPQELVDAFTAKVRVDTAGSEAHLKRLFSHFKFVQQMVLELKLFPKDYEDRAGFVYQYLRDKRASVDYSLKLIQMLNMWGKFAAKKTGSFFAPLPMPPRKMRAALAKAQRGKSGVRKESERLTVAMLKDLKLKLPAPQYNWLFCSLWLGLRPSEVDAEAGKAPELHAKNGVKILAVYQSKIEGEDEEEGYKYVPLLYPEQQEALKLLKSGAVERPTPAFLREASGAAIDTYCGRKGFVDLMQELGQRLEDAAIWMGHKDLKTTLEHYKDPTNVPFTPIKKKEAS